MRLMLRLEGKTEKGKQRVEAHGPLWKVLDTARKVGFTSQKGVWYMAMSVDTGHLTWVKKVDDERYTILETIKTEEDTYDNQQ